MSTYPLAVYTADHGLSWNYPRSEIGFAELDACRKAFGQLPDFDSGAKGFCGVWAAGDKAFVMRCQSVKAWDFRGRDATYLTVTWMPREDASTADFERILAAPEMSVPIKNPPPFFAVSATKHQAPLNVTEPFLRDGLSRAGGVIAGSPADATIAIKCVDGNSQASCIITSKHSASVTGAQSFASTASEYTQNAPISNQPVQNFTLIATFVLMILLLLSSSLFLGFQWRQLGSENSELKNEIVSLTNQIAYLETQLNESQQNTVGPAKKTLHHVSNSVTNFPAEFDGMFRMGMFYGPFSSRQIIIIERK